MAHTIGGVDVGDPRLRQALKDSLLDGVFATAMIALVETFGVAGAVALGVAPVPIALLTSLPVWLGTMAQLALRTRIAGRPRKPLVVRAVRCQATLLFGLALTGLASEPLAPWLYVGVFVLHSASNAVVGHLWMSWFSDVCPAPILGRHAAWRSAVFAVVQLTVGLAAGGLTRAYDAHHTPWHVFAVAFAAAGTARFVSSGFLWRQYEPAPPPTPPATARFRPSGALKRFSLAIALLQGASVMAGPFFAVWFLRDLRFSYWAFASVGAATVAGNLAFSRLVGRLADHHGAARVLSVSAALAALVPFPYLLITSPWAIALANFYSGAAWAGVNVAAFKYLLTASRGDVTRSSIVYSNVRLATSVLLFSVLGGVLASRLPVVLDWQLRSLFLLSGFVRLIVVATTFLRIPNLEVTDVVREAGPGRFYQIFRWKGPGTTQS